MGIQRNQIIEYSEKNCSYNNIKWIQYTQRATFKQLNMLKIADQLCLQELKFYFKYIDKKLPAYLLDWTFISNVNVHLRDTRTSSKMRNVRTKHEFAKKKSEIGLENPTYYKRYSCNISGKDTHTACEVSQYMQNNSSYKNIHIHVQCKIVIRVINIIISNF